MKNSVLLFLSVLMLSSCIQNLGTNEGSEFQFVDLNPATITFADINKIIMGPKCLRCHAWASDEAEFDSRITPGDPENSALYQQIESGAMPLGGPELTSSEKKLVYDFISNKVATVVDTTPPPVEDPILPELTPEEQFQFVKNEILIPNCMSCHAWVNDDEIINSFISPGDAANSKLFQVVESNQMPLFGPPLTDEEKDTIKEMINVQPNEEVIVEPILTPEEEFQLVKKEILIPNCLSCHAWIDNDQTLKSKFVPGDAGNSRLYQLIESDRMPLGGPPLSDNDKMAIFDMINNQTI